jgi:hypothetical protein
MRAVMLLQLQLRPKAAIQEEEVPANPHLH